MKYLFQLGREPEISIAELTAVFARDQILHHAQKESGGYLIVETESTLNPDELMRSLGGTIKIGELILELKNPIEETAAYLQEKQPEGKIEFSISGVEARRTGLHIKKTLTAEGRGARYIEANNTATIIHNHLVEKGSDLVVIKNQLFATRAVQPIEEWSERDYGRPGRDSMSGMLPPKLARIMINLSGAEKDDVILDPFCGSGTVLTEGIQLGFNNIIGADHSPTAIEDSKKNIEWICNNNRTPHQNGAGQAMKQSNNVKLLLSDARKLTSQLKAKSVDAVITEPYLGKPLRGSEPENFVKTHVNELRRLYVETFASLYSIMKPNGVVIFIIPRFKRGNDWVMIECHKEIKKAGFDILPFSEEHPYLLYFRPTQHLGREIWRFVKK